MAPAPPSLPDPRGLDGPDPAQPAGAPGEGAPGPSAAERGGSPTGGLARLRGLVDSLLVADVFLVLAGALWFALAVVLHSQGVEGPLTLFQTLWEPLFTPAIGLLMAAALLSGALGWWQRRGQR